MRNSNRATGLIVGLLMGVLIFCLWVRSWKRSDGFQIGIGKSGVGLESTNGNVVFWGTRDDPFFDLKGLRLNLDNIRERSDFPNFEHRKFGKFRFEQYPSGFELAIPHWVFVAISISCGVGSFFLRSGTLLEEGAK